MREEELMDGNKTTEINYEVIDRCVSNISQSINDYYMQIDMGKLQMIMDNSRGNYSDELRLAAKETKNACQMVLNLMIESKEMLQMAKRMFSDMDSETSRNVKGD